METKRQKQVAELIKRHFSWVLQREGSFIYGNEVMVSVTRVRMSPDLSLAKIYLSIFNTENKQAVMIMLEENQFRLRQALVARVRKHVRRIPDINLYLDETIDEMYRLDALFKKLHRENQMGDPASDPEDQERD